MASDMGNPASRELGYCPCCGYRTLPEGTPGSYDVCSVCYWVDDLVQFDDIEYVGRSNHVSLAMGRENFRQYGASDPELLRRTREPDGEKRDPNWPYE